MPIHTESERNGLKAEMERFEVQMPVPDFQQHMKEGASQGGKHDKKGRTVLGNLLHVNEKAEKNKSCL